eukprot:TRINITY_DN938_c6_g1_i1.p1 TRINITY_DN938_c6_g1~~TRINITY_DN938_c6_g1_i1.p1  ORF type:complete len:280 (+),score=43.22 TRINITY_DN938_c6_g1_i1:83-922(+)
MQPAAQRRRGRSRRGSAPSSAAPSSPPLSAYSDDTESNTHLPSVSQRRDSRCRSPADSCGSRRPRRRSRPRTTASASSVASYDDTASSTCSLSFTPTRPAYPARGPLARGGMGLLSGDEEYERALRLLRPPPGPGPGQRLAPPRRQYSSTSKEDDTLSAEALRCVEALIPRDHLRRSALTAYCHRRGGGGPREDFGYGGYGANKQTSVQTVLRQEDTGWREMPLPTPPQKVRAPLYDSAVPQTSTRHDAAWLMPAVNRMYAVMRSAPPKVIPPMKVCAP